MFDLKGDDMNHQPFEEWLLNHTPIDPDQKRMLDSHIRNCSYCSALLKTGKVFRDVRMASPGSGFVTRFEARLAEQKTVELKRKILGSIFFSLGGIILLSLLALPYMEGLLASPAGWITALVNWAVFLLTTLLATLQAGTVIFEILRGMIPPFAWMIMISGLAGISLLWSVSIWRFVRVPRGV
jgi:hypothetical protein